VDIRPVKNLCQLFPLVLFQTTCRKNTRAAAFTGLLGKLSENAE